MRTSQTRPHLPDKSVQGETVLTSRIKVKLSNHHKLRALIFDFLKFYEKQLKNFIVDVLKIFN